MLRIHDLRFYISLLLKCQSVQAIKATLEGFSRDQDWSLEERSIISSLYTPIVLSMVQEDEKWKTLEDLAPLCWDRRKAA